MRNLVIICFQAFSQQQWGGMWLKQASDPDSKDSKDWMKILLILNICIVKFICAYE